MNEHEMILTSVLGCHRSELYYNRPDLSIEEQGRFDAMILRLDAGEPLQYILGEVEFLGLRLHVDPRVLIPRPETEIMASMLVKLFAERNDCSNGLRVLDIGTGSGCLALGFAHSFKNCHVDAVDISADALDVARQNAMALGLEEKIQFFRGDICQMWPMFPCKAYDLIISNPPYIPSSDIDGLPLNVRQEPRLALDGGADGLMFYREMIREAGALLVPDGMLACEFWDGQDRDLRMMFDTSWSLQFFKDLSGAYRFFTAQKVS